MLAKRRALPVELKEKYGHEIVHQLLVSREFSEAQTILCYVSTADEVPTDELIKAAWRLGKKVGVPKVLGPHEMEFFEIRDFKDLQAGYKGILEPTAGKIIKDKKGLVIVPGTVFDIYGIRIGYGGGFYDSYLQKHPEYKKAAFAFSMQITEKIPAESHDISMDYIYTEKGVYRRCQQDFQKIQ